MTTPPPLDIPAIAARALAASKTDLAKKRWRVDGYTVWSGDWTKDGQQHPVVQAYGCGDPGVPWPPGTTALLAHIAGCDPTTVLALTARIAALEAGLVEACDIAEQPCDSLRAGMEPDARSSGCDEPTCLACYPEPGDPPRPSPNPRIATLRNLATNTESKEGK